jgi:hypothetical protein
MSYYQKHFCWECSHKIDNKVFNYSYENFGLSLCRNCQKWFRDIAPETTQEAVSLYFELKRRGVPAELEKYDGFKTIDIAVTHAKVNIEVDGAQHNFNSNQALADLRRTYYSFKKGYLTLRIPNSLVRHHLDETANMITEFLMESQKQLLW